MAELAFDPDRFLRALQQDRVIRHGSPPLAWNAKGGAAVEYYGANGLDYRTWMPDTSLCRGGVALMLSVKLDQMRSGMDDHLVMLTTFNRACGYVTAQAAIQSFKHMDRTEPGAVIVAAPGIDVEAALHASLRDSIAKILRGSIDQGLAFMADLGAANLGCIRQAIVLR